MAIQGARELRTHLAAVKKGRIEPVYLVFGAEGYLVRTASEALVAAIAEGTGAEIVKLDASGRPPEAVMEPVASLSLFASAQVVVVRGFSHLLTGDHADSLLARLDAGVGDGCALVFVAPGDGPDRIDKRVKGYKGLVKRGVVVELNRQEPEDLVEWLREQADHEGKQLSPQAARILLDRIGPDMQVLRNELDKVLLFCLDKQRIDPRDVERLVGKSREEAVWSVSEAVAAREPVRALGLLRDTLAAGTYPLILLTLLIRQGRHLLQARLLWEEAGRPAFRGAAGFRSQVRFENGAFGGGADDVTTIHPYAAFRRFEVARSFETGELRAMLVRLRRADLDAKTGAFAADTGADKDRSQNVMLEELILDLCALAGGRGSRAA